MDDSSSESAALSRIVLAAQHIEFEVAVGETVMSGAHRAGLFWPTICGGKASCGVCAFQVSAGDDALDVAAQLERDIVDTLPPSTRGRNRLACQARCIVSGATVEGYKRGVRLRKEHVQ